MYDVFSIKLILKFYEVIKVIKDSDIYLNLVQFNKFVRAWKHTRLTYVCKITYVKYMYVSICIRVNCIKV